MPRLHTLRVIQKPWTLVSKQILNRSFKWDTKHRFWSRGCKDIRGQPTVVAWIVELTLRLIKKLSNINSWSEIDIKIWNNIINGLWKTKKMATWTLRLKDILWFRYEHPLKCKKSWNRGALADNFWRPSILLLWNFLIF